MEFDVAIVGAGPAGATCLLGLAGKGLRVLVIEKAAFPREKACGDAVPGLALRVWEEMAPELVRQLHTLPSALPLADGFVCGPYGAKCRIAFSKPGLMVKRAELDTALFDYARRQTPCTHVTASLKDLERLPEGFRLTTADGRTFTTSRLAAADGATGPSRRLLLGEAWQPADISLAVRAYLPQPRQAGAGGSALALWFDRSVMPGYIWAFPLADGSLNVGAGALGGRGDLHRNLKKAIPAWMARPDTSDEHPHGDLDPSTWLGQILPLGRDGRPASGPGYVLLGDAAGLIAPATGDGIGQAAYSGRLASQVLVQSLSLPLQDSKDLLHRLYDLPLYRKLGPSFTAQRNMIRLGQRAPRLMDLTIRLAAHLPWLRKRLASL